MTRESRKVERFAVQFPCKFWNKTDKSDGTVLNLSAQGCVITAAHLPSVFTYVSLDIDLLTDEGLVTIELAGVRWVSERRCGLEFIRIRPDMLMKLRAFAWLLEQTS
ncbi:MAG TPA: PilZ domain-containing protein [Nitrospira sp.]|nr:PilZ domain-containing protein [Nitrospira sp.]